MAGPYIKGNTFFYADFIKDAEEASRKGSSSKLNESQLREFGLPLRDRGVDLIDYLRQFDRQRNGSVPASIFLREISSTPLGQLVCKAYTNPVSGYVEYVRLANDVKRVLDAKYSGAPIDPYKIQEMINQIAKAVKSQGEDLFQLFQSIDRYKKRRIQPSEFVRIINSLNVSISPEGMVELADAFTENALFDYVTFNDEVQRAISILNKKTPSQAPVKIDIDSVLLKLSKEIQSRHSNILPQFEQFDVNRNGLIPAQRFMRVLYMNNFSLDQSEIRSIEEEFNDGKGNVDYLTFLNFVMPQASPKVQVEDILIRLQDHLNGHQIQIKPKLLRFDKNRTGKIQFSQLLSVLRDVEFDLNNNEQAVLKQTFARGSDEMVNIDDFTELVDPIIEPPKPKQIIPRKEYVEPATIVLDIITKIASLIQKQGINLIDEFKGYDTRHTNTVTKTIFTDILLSLPLSLTDDEILSLTRFYSNSENSEINYQNFCQDINEFGFKRIKQSDPLPSTPSESPLNNILKTLKLAFYSKNISPDTIFIPYDTNGNGTIPTSRLMPILSGFGLHLSESEINLLVDNFTDHRITEKFRYKRLCSKLNEIEISQNDLKQTQKVEKVTTNSDVLRITSQLREKLLARHKRVETPFRGMKSESIPARDFRRCVESFGLIISESDMQKLLREYKVNFNGDIDWKRFCYDVEMNKIV
ncbi:EF hand family protein [Histomonas meleagridis]|uniref:EF hand family protein n=1 Tax=Histomonas meleagridis TaxID=135588 RepID=UPI0035596624|nr:EF hand family protein [Histomonas meleagridis]KAH0801204.1 EF hand family protein [Histomonas meleagridis]